MRALDPRYLWVPEGEDYGGVCDRHVVCSNRDLPVCLGLVDPLVAQPAKYEWALRSLNMESFFKLRLAEEGALPRLRRFPRMMFTHNLKSDRTLWSQPSAVAEPIFGAHMKYVDEYIAAKKTCGLCGWESAGAAATVSGRGSRRDVRGRNRSNTITTAATTASQKVKKWPCEGCPYGITVTGLCRKPPARPWATQLRIAIKETWLRCRLTVLVSLPLLLALGAIVLTALMCTTRNPNKCTDRTKRGL